MAARPVRRRGMGSIGASVLVATVLVGLGSVTPSVATTADGDVVLGNAGVNVGCTPGSAVNCEGNATSIYDPNAMAIPGALAFEVGVGHGGVAIDGYSEAGYGVYGESGTGSGMYATSNGADAFIGDLPSSSTGTNAVTASAENGHNGLNAESNAGPLGLNGQYHAALFAQNTSTGTAVWARNLNDGGNGAYVEAYGSHSTALKVCGCQGAAGLSVSGGSTFHGTTSFDRSGSVIVSAGTAQATKSGISLSGSSKILATIQGNVAGVDVQGVTKVTGTPGSFTIHLNTSTPVNLVVAWFVLG